MDTVRHMPSSVALSVVEMKDGRAFIELDDLCLLPKANVEMCLEFVRLKLKNIPGLRATIKRWQGSYTKLVLFAANVANSA